MPSAPSQESIIWSAGLVNFLWELVRLRRYRAPLASMRPVAPSVGSGGGGGVLRPRHSFLSVGCAASYRKDPHTCQLGSLRLPAMATPTHSSGLAPSADQPLLSLLFDTERPLEEGTPGTSPAGMQMLERHAMPALGNTPLDRLDRGDVLRVINPIWTTRPETARRVRQRMRTVFQWAIAHGFMEANLAGEAIDGALPRCRR